MALGIGIMVCYQKSMKKVLCVPMPCFTNCDPYPPSHLAEYLGEEQDTSLKFSMEETFENFLYHTKLVSEH
jgi:hypothetical protein